MSFLDHYSPCQVCQRSTREARLLFRADDGKSFLLAGNLCQKCILWALVSMGQRHTGVFQLEAADRDETLAVGVYNRDPTADELAKKRLIELADSPGPKKQVH